MEPDHCLTHFPKRTDCEICLKCKMQSAPWRKKDSMIPDATEDEPKEFGDSMTADTMVCGPRDHSVDGDTCAHVIKDRASNWVEGNLAKTKGFIYVNHLLF